MPVDINLMKRIKEKKKKIDENPEYYKKRQLKINESLVVLGDIYSWYQENPEIQDAIVDNLHIKSSKKLHKKVYEGIRQIKNAWYYLTNNPALKKNFLKNLEEEHIKKVAKLIDPKNNIKGYRKQPEFTSGDVSLNFPGIYQPPKPREIHDLISRCLNNVKQGDLFPIEKAAYTHLNLAAIQPFWDGNKRTARLIQDRILYDYGFPPAIIHPGERKAYMDVFCLALQGLKNNKLEKQRPFFDFIAGKVNMALDDILNYMEVDIKHLNNSEKDNH